MVMLVLVLVCNVVVFLELMTTRKVMIGIGPYRNRKPRAVVLRSAILPSSFVTPSSPSHPLPFVRGSDEPGQPRFSATMAPSGGDNDSITAVFFPISMRHSGNLAALGRVILVIAMVGRWKLWFADAARQHAALAEDDAKTDDNDLPMYSAVAYPTLQSGYLYRV
jgi:hypothetical protein